MALLILIDDYSPKSSKVSPKMIKQLATELNIRGEKVIVIAPNEETNAKRLEITNENGIEVWRFKSGKLKNIPHIQRGINESLLPFRGWWAIKNLIRKTDVNGVIFYSPSIFLGPLAQKIIKTKDVPSYLILRDFFPQWLIDVGMISENSLFARYFKFIEKINYKTATKIGVMSPNNLALFKQLQPVFSEKAEVLYNWTNPTVDQYTPEFSSIRKKLDLNDKVIFFYGGNIGHAQDMANLMRLAVRLKNEPKAHFLFIGDGDEVELIKKIAATEHLNNFTYLPYVSQEEYVSILADIDIGLFSLAANHTAHNFPGKVFGYMAHKIPVLGSVNKGNDLIDILNENKAGLATVNGNDEQLYTDALRLLNEPELRAYLGDQGFETLCTKFSTSKAADQISTTLQQKK